VGICDRIDTVRGSALSGGIKWESSGGGEREKEMFYLTTLTIAKII